MKITSRLNLMMLVVALLPIIIFLLCFSVKIGYVFSIVITGILAAFTAFFAARIIFKGVGHPVSVMSDAVKSFRESEYKLDAPLPKDGWKEANVLISALNRLMLELSAYRSFQLNQVVEERAKAQALIETISDAILLVDDRGRLLHSNKLALRILKISKEDQDIVLPASVGEEGFHPVLKNILVSSENYLKTDVSVQGPDRESSVVRNFRVMSRQFHMAAFNRPGRVIVIRDVSVEKEIESARETFFHMITHDMRTPLTSILGHAQIMEKNISPSDMTNKCLHAIINASGRLNGMIQDILNMIKLEKRSMSLNKNEIDADLLCARIVEVYEPLASRKNINFSVSSQEDKVFFDGDTGLIDRVICNLVGNSMKFTPPKGSVTIAYRYEGEDVVFSVTDTGPGIPLERQADIFGKFSQLDEHKYMGFGLGLAMCKMAVELHGGNIKVESEEGKGSTFIFTIPKAFQEPKESKDG